MFLIVATEMDTAVTYQLRVLTEELCVEKKKLEECEGKYEAALSAGEGQDEMKAHLLSKMTRLQGSITTKETQAGELRKTLSSLAVSSTSTTPASAASTSSDSAAAQGKTPEEEKEEIAAAATAERKKKIRDRLISAQGVGGGEKQSGGKRAAPGGGAGAVAEKKQAKGTKLFYSS